MWGEGALHKIGREMPLRPFARLGRPLRSGSYGSESLTRRDTLHRSVPVPSVQTMDPTRLWSPQLGRNAQLRGHWAYITAAGIGADKGSPLFRTLGGRGRKQLTAARMARQDARRMIVRRALATGIITKLGCHTFRATGITVYLLNGGLLEYAQQMAAHESARTTKLYDRRNDQVTLDQVERIVL